MESASPQGDSTQILLERKTYFYRSSLFDYAKILLAEEDGRLVGTMSYAIKDVWLGGNVCPVAFAYDLRSDPTYRRSMKRGLFRLWQNLQWDAQEHGAPLHYMNVKEDNHDSLRVMYKGGAQRVGTFGVCTLPSLPRGYTAPSPCSDPLEGAARVEELVGQRDMRPTSLVDCYRRGLELGYLKGVYRLERGRSLAQVSVWDLSELYRGRALRIPVPLRAVAGVINPVSKVLPVPRLPTVGQPVHYWHCFDAYTSGRRGSSLMRQLLQGLRCLAAAQGIDILALFYYLDEPLLDRPRFLLQKTMNYHTLAITRTGEFPQPPLYLDIRDL